jgi:hypothetical protein
MKISALTPVSSVDGTELSPCNQSSTTVRTTLQAIANLFKGTRGTAIASASSINLGAATGSNLHITGTTTITSLGTVAAGVERRVIFDGALTLTHNATSLVLPGNANITTAAGDSAVFISEGSGNWRCVSYNKADGTSVGAATIANDSVTYAKMQNVSATQRVIGRNTAGSGDPEEVTFAQFMEWVGTPSNDDFIQRKSGAFTNRTVAQVSADLQGTGLITDAVGYRTVPQNSQSAAYTCVAADSGKHILHPSADTTARTFTIPANSSVAYPVGTALTFVNQNGAGSITIAITTDTMRLAGAGTTGSRTLAANGIATALKVTSTEWIISGTGLT